MRRFEFTRGQLVVSDSGDLCDYEHYKRKAEAVEAIYDMIGDGFKDAGESDEALTLDAITCRQLGSILEKA